MGLVCKTEFAFSFVYKAAFNNGLIEHEYDHVYFGISDDVPVADEAEVKSWRYCSLETLQAEIKSNPEIFTEWIKICLPKITAHYKTFFIENKL